MINQFEHSTSKERMTSTLLKDKLEESPKASKVVLTYLLPISQQYKLRAS